MAKICDNKSVGLIAELDGRYAMIRRKNYPVCWAMIAGHVIEHGTERNAIIAEAEEEGSLVLGRFIEIWHGPIDNPCKRIGGTHHDWVVYEAYDWTGQLRAGSDAIEAKLMTAEELHALAEITRSFARKVGTSTSAVGPLTRSIFGEYDPDRDNTDPEWKENPGLEPVWLRILEKLGKI